MAKVSLTQKTEKLYLLAHTFDEVINGDVFKYCSFTANGKTIPNDGSRTISVIDARKCAPKRLNCDRVIIHRDGSFTCVYGGFFVRWFKNLFKATYKKDITKVVFRKFSDGEIIALFPHIVCANGGKILSYMHVGQHGAASVDIVRNTKAATLAEFFPLYKELKQLGYNMKIGKRLTKKVF